MRYDKKGRVLQQKWVQEDKRGKLAEPVEAKRAKKKALDPATYAQDDTKGRGMTRTRRGKTILVGVVKQYLWGYASRRFTSAGRELSKT